MKATSFHTFLRLLLVLILVVGYTAAFAQRLGRSADKPARQELQAYYAQNVLPVVREQRQKLEAQLSADDKVALASYRAQLRTSRQEGKALLQSFRPAKLGQAQPTRPELTDAQRQQLQQQRTQRQAVMQKVTQVAQKYDTNIKQLASEIEPQREKWTMDTKAIVMKYATPEQQEKLAHFAGNRHKAGLGHFFRPSVFLLMDPNAPTAKQATKDLGTSLFPNPSNGTTQLEYNVAKAGPVTIELLDGRGNTLRKILDQQSKEKGAHVLVVNVDDLSNGTYFYKITSRTGSETKRFLKQ
ncbi:T9SS type A sorting domain-containing protein [Hymenobacter cavernae]|uniref:Secretion system C-terminal sorting domain-containing protein n=1 Tax=Hymenobacter cavernae TaxID=2044852 RepID=A0ABQ1UHT0_9BACT|nr:T9SS type A sorting domain-containing protein [Hymenobacter cavernae]GGF19365.1 hypothetical protein GCM10011383_33670 [Hymenobacter cavernae]